MSEGASAVGVVHIAVGLVVIGCAIPLLRGKVPMNRWYGVRIAKSFTSPSNWYQLNRFGAIQLVGYGGGLILIGVAAILAPPRVGSLWFFAALAAPGLLLAPMLFQLLRFAKRLP